MRLALPLGLLYRRMDVGLEAAALLCRYMGDGAWKVNCVGASKAPEKMGLILARVRRMGFGLIITIDSILINNYNKRKRKTCTWPCSAGRTPSALLTMLLHNERAHRPETT